MFTLSDRARRATIAFASTGVAGPNVPQLTPLAPSTIIGFTDAIPTSAAPSTRRPSSASNVPVDGFMSIRSGDMRVMSPSISTLDTSDVSDSLGPRGTAFTVSDRRQWSNCMGRALPIADVDSMRFVITVFIRSGFQRIIFTCRQFQGVGLRSLSLLCSVLLPAIAASLKSS